MSCNRGITAPTGHERTAKPSEIARKIALLDAPHVAPLSNYETCAPAVAVTLLH
jgi:hypothetical protein